MCNVTTSVGHTVEGPKVLETVIPVQKKGLLNSEKTRAKIVKAITSKVIQLSTENGVHPGDVAITFDDYDFQQIFGCQGSTDEESYDIHSALDQCAKSVIQKNPERAPMSSSSIDESVMFLHEKTLTSCGCKYFIGPFRQLKGLTVKVVVYLSIQGSSQGHNRLAAYTSLTRSSCLVEMFYIQVESMKMVNYQKDKYEALRLVRHFSVRTPEGDIFYVSNAGLVSPRACVGDFPSALGSGVALIGTSYSTGTLYTFLGETDGEEFEGLELD